MTFLRHAPFVPFVPFLGVLLSAGGALVASSAASAGMGAPARCEAVSGDRMATVVELYTSEGCSSCPPADRWVSGLQDRADVVSLGFHVDYWDRLGWRDRFASPAWTRRQAESHATSGAGFSYTPQVIVDGRDWRRWPALPAPSSTPAAVTLRLAREGDAWELAVQPRAGAPRRLTAELAVVDDHLSSHVAAGENEGSTLHHEAVVRQLLPVEPWSADGAHAVHGRFSPPPLEAGASRHWAAVVRDADTGRPVQALALRCPGG